MIESNMSGANGDSSVESSSKSANTSTNTERKETDSSLCKSPVPSVSLEKHYYAKLPWGVLKQTQNLSSNLKNLITSVPNVNIDDDFFKIENKKPGEYLMNLIVFKFMQLGSRKISLIMNGEKRDKFLREFFQKNEDPDFDKLMATMAQVAEKSLPSLVRTLLMWHEAQISNLTYLKQQNQQQNDSNPLNSSSKAALKTKQHLMQAKMESDILDERKELMVNCILCSALKEILKQLPFHPGIDDLLNYIIDLSFQRFVPKETFANSSSSFYQHHQLYLDNRFTVDLFAECIGVMAHSRFALVKKRFLIEFERLKSNKSPNQGSTLSSSLSGQTVNPQSTMSTQQISSPATNSQSQPLSVSSTPNMNQSLISSQSIIKLLMGMKFIRVKMVPIEDLEASFQFLNDLAQYFVDVKDKDIKHTLAGLFVEILVPIIGIVKNEVNVPCLKSFVDILYQHALELSAKSKHRLACLPLLTCLLCVSQKQFFLNYWFNFGQLCLQQMKSKETTLSRIALESVIRLVWVYMIRIKGEKSSDTNVRLNAIVQSLFPKGSKLVMPKEMPANLYVKLINYIAYEKLDYAMKEVIYELLSIDVNQSASDFGDQPSAPSGSGQSGSAASAVSAGVSLGNQIFKNSKENMIILPLRMEIGLKAFTSISDTLQYQKENPNGSPPPIPSNFTTPDTDQLTIYPNQTLGDTLCRDIGLAIYFDHVRRAFQDILKTLDTTIGRGYLMTRPENTGSASTEDGSQIDAVQDEQTSLDELSAFNSQKESMFSSDMRSRLNLFRTCIALMPRLMPSFRENELVEILTRLTIHLDDELKLAAFKTLRTLVCSYPSWRKPIFTGFTNFILKEISDMFPKLIENALKMLIQLLSAWKSAVSDEQSLDDSCQILYHLEGFSLFTLCHSSVQRRRFGHFILHECKQIGEMTKCFKIYTMHNYALDILDVASIQAIKSLHLQCLNINLSIQNTRVDLAYLIDQSAIWDSCVNLSNYSEATQTHTQTNSLPKNQRAPSLSADEPLSEIEASSTSEASHAAKLGPDNRAPSATSLNYVFTFDPWTECLATFFAYDFIFTKCPQARADAWLFIFARLQQILPFVDPNEPHEPARTSLLFGNNALERSRKIGERDINLNLWKNYLMGACCLTTGSDQDLYSSEYRKYTSRVQDPLNMSSGQNLASSSTAVNYDFTIVESTSKFYANFGTHTSLIKIIVPYLKCDMSYFREIIIRGLGRINIEAQRDLIEELNPLIKETSDFKRQDKIRRLKKKDLARLALVRIFELMAEHKTLSKRIMDTYKNPTNLQHFNDEQMRKMFVDFIDTIYSYVESEGDKSYDHLNQIRLHFSMFVHKFIDSVAKEKRSVIFNDALRHNLFNLMTKWSGKFCINGKDHSAKLSASKSGLCIHQHHYAHLNCYHFYDELELAAARACAALLYSGNVLDYAHSKSSIVFAWLNNLLEVVNSEMKLYENCKYQVSNEAYTLCANCLTQLLELSLYTITSQKTPSGANINLSLNVSPVFDWVIDKCYATLSQEIADLCFLSLSKVYLDYLNESKPNSLSKNNLLKSSFESIYLGSILSVTLLNVGSTRLNIHEASVTLLRAMNKNFLQDSFEAKLDSKSAHLSTGNMDPISSFLSIDFDVINSLVMASKSQPFISEYLAKKNPDQTMFVFSELTSRFESCTSFSLRRSILNVLVPWFYNIELINPNVVTDTNKTNVNNVLQLESGCGSVEATHLVLNNLFYLTCKYADNFGAELEVLWATLASTWRSNLKIICRFVYVMISLAAYEMLAHGKRIVCYLSRVCPERIVDELVNELEMIDSFTAHISKEAQFPFYRYLKVITVPASPPPSPKLANNYKKSSIYFVNQDEDDDDQELYESLEFANQSDFNPDDEEYDDSDLSDTDTSQSEPEFSQHLKKSQPCPAHLKLDQSQLPLPVKYQSFACPLNKILYHSGHHHHQQNLVANQDYMPLFSYHHNYLHHNHYFHFSNMQRGSVSLMLLSELVSNDGADFDWSQYLPILFH
ncbi:furry isoform X3, partial [Brachionus plicatilis]